MDVAASGGFKNVTSPIPYLFGGIALMLAIVTFSLIVLACCCQENSSSTTLTNEDKSMKNVEMVVDLEPKIVVIMAGDSNPTYLAKPVSSTCHTEEMV
ncbi:protein GLUTAMINE DUMPER 5-like [Lathyrus oleraceus]|uniref:protein GLUTAMINE DUMPER 5-like n=1 Tax=Pisum sativum TaxID=3888 RepID=UPI0021D33047|nr:protein GLUTAMINE DUMPER 5-like [Pisum sativum]